MIKRLSFLVFVLASLSANADERWRATITNVIEDSMCIPKLNGEGYLHVDEDVAGLIISVIGEDGAENFLFDIATEIEDVVAPGTGAYTAPSANNVRVSPDGSTGGDCTEMQFADAVYAGEDWIQIRVTDGQTTIMDYQRWVFLDLITTRDTGQPLGPIAITTVTNQTTFVLPEGASNIDAYNELIASIVGGTEECNDRTVTDFTISPPTITIDSVCPFTVAAGDIIRLRVGASGKQSRDTNDLVLALPSADDVNTQVDAALADIGLDHIVSIQGTADSGTASTLVDAARTEVDFYWNNTHILVVQFASGPEAQCVRGFTASTDTLAVHPAFSQAVATEDYILIPALTCRNFP